MFSLRIELEFHLKFNTYKYEHIDLRAIKIFNVLKIYKQNMINNMVINVLNQISKNKKSNSNDLINAIS